MSFVTRMACRRKSSCGTCVISFNRLHQYRPTTTLTLSLTLPRTQTGTRSGISYPLRGSSPAAAVTRHRRVFRWHHFQKPTSGLSVNHILQDPHSTRMFVPSSTTLRPSHIYTGVDHTVGSIIVHYGSITRAEGGVAT